jgi:anti-sigma factor RsiW
VSSHEDIRDLLPWYAAGTLDDKESAAVEAALTASEQLREELRQLRALQEAVLAPRADEPAFRPALIAGAWQRIDAYELDRRAAQRMRSGAVSLIEGVRQLLAGLSRPAQWALAAQFAVILTLAGVLAVTIRSERVYQTSAGSTEAPTNGPHLTVIFQPEATAADIQGLLGKVNAQIVYGPTNEQIYTIALPHADEAAADRALTELRGASRIVSFVQREQR